MRTLAAAIPLLLSLASGTALAQAPTSVTSKKAPELGLTDRVVVKYHAGGVRAADKDLAQAMAQRARVSSLVKASTLSSGAVVYKLPEALTLEEARVVAKRLSLDPAVQYAAPDVRVRALSTNDPWFSSQWALKRPNQAFGASDFARAWARTNTTALGNVVVAVIDTGRVIHPDLSSAELVGYDFITDTTMAGDGNGRDTDPTDVGDFCAAESTNSSWHGLKVASQIGAIANNGQGIAGAASGVKVQQIRALGRCGGYLSDVADAVTWAAGGAVAGAPTNTNIAKVINLSLGSAAGASCFAYMQDAVSYAFGQGVTVVAAAGNEGAPSLGVPAACDNVIAVGAHSESGDLATYSNHSVQVALTAPAGGSCRTQAGSCLSQPTLALGNSGTTSQGTNTDAVYFAGTSAATPHVAAAVAMLYSVKPDITPAQVRTTLASSARPHAGDSFCAATPGQCGAGMLDVEAALAQHASAQPEPSVISVSGPMQKVPGSSTVELRVTVTGPHAVSTVEWTQNAGETVTMQNQFTPTMRFTAPAGKTTNIEGLLFTVRVTLANAEQLVEQFVVRVDNPPVLADPTPAPQNISAGTPFTKPLAGLDQDGDTVVVNLLQGPAGMRIDNVGGVHYLAWPNPTPGTHEVHYQATAAGVDSSIVTMTLVVQGSGSQNPAPGSDAGGGGGGSLGLASLLMVGLAGAARRRSARRGTH